jgi:hypothetical protein
MHWPWQRTTVTDPKAQAAVADAETKLSMQHRLTPEVDRIADRLVERRHQNRFAELLEEAIQLRRHA